MAKHAAGSASKHPNCDLGHTEIDRSVAEWAQAISEHICLRMRHTVHKKPFYPYGFCQRRFLGEVREPCEKLFNIKKMEGHVPLPTTRTPSVGERVRSAGKEERSRLLLAGSYR